MRLNRNIITQADVSALLDPTKSSPKTLTRNPPAGFVAAIAPAAEQTGAVSAATAATAGAPAGGGAQPAAPGGVTVYSEDDYLTKIVKYVPAEVLAAYLFIAGVIDSNVTGKHDRAIWLGALLIGILVLTIPYDRVVLNIIRWQQIAVSVVGLAVYVFAVGGWFATTTWYHQWYASIVLPVFGLLIAILKLPELPAEK
jgi:hypothetical protein